MVVVRAVFNGCFKDGDGEVDSLLFVEDNVVGDFSCIERGGENQNNRARHK